MGTTGMYIKRDLDVLVNIEAQLRIKTTDE